MRHPFERLVSAFRDKFELSRKYGYVYSHYASKIISQPAGINSRRPTFREFVEYLLRERLEEYNDHWLPYWLHCHMCEMEYDVIGKMETWNEDVKFITGREEIKGTVSVISSDTCVKMVMPDLQRYP